MKYIFTVLLILFSSSCFTQVIDDCIQPKLVLGDDMLQQTRMNVPERLTDFEPITFNIYFWGFKRENNTGNDLFTLENIENTVANLNALYNDGNITFKLIGYETIIYPSYYILNSPIQFHTMVRTMLEDGTLRPDAFNVYVSEKYEGFGGITFGYNDTIIGIPSTHLVNSGVVEHEIGHCFNLYHTNESIDTNAGCESAIRDPNNSYFNADLAGDQVTDTAAGYKFELREIDPETCTVLTNRVDCFDFPYEIPSTLLRNFMTISASICTKDQLTFGQYVRIREAIHNDPFGSFRSAIAD